MRTLYALFLKDLIFTFFVAASFFVLILQMGDLFANLWKYVNSGLTLKEIFYLTWLFFPKCVSYALPIATLFSVAYVLGIHHANNEMIAIHSSGISLFRLVIPYFLVGLFVSVGSFFFEDHFVIPTFSEKGRLFRDLVSPDQKQQRQNTTALSDKGRFVYQAKQFNPETEEIVEFTVVERDERGNFVKRWEAEQAFWKGFYWELARVRLFSLKGGKITEKFFETYEARELSISPDSFREESNKVEELSLKEITTLIERFRRSGNTPRIREMRTEYHKRFAFALTPLIVTLVSCSIAGRFRRNTLLVSLLMSLVVAVFYYVLQLVSSLLAKAGFFPPLMGAWFGFILMSIGGGWLFSRVRT